MRNISAASLALLQETSGIEPVILIKIFWANGPSVTYSDRRFSAYGFEGRIQSISGIEDVLDIQANSSSASVDIVLDDTDGQVKNIFNYNDIHKSKVQVLQWFAEIPPSEAFVIFEGEISSPIVWKESDRTLSFAVLSKIEDVEVGFSVEEGSMANFPQSFFGKPWPVVFGVVGGIPALRVNEAPRMILLKGFGIVDGDVWDFEIAKLRKSIENLYAQWLASFTAGLKEAYIAARFKSDFPEFGLVDDPDRAEQHDQAAQGYYAQAAKYWADFTNLELELQDQLDLRGVQESYEAAHFPVFAKNLPLNLPLSFKFSTWKYTGIYNGSEIVNVSKEKIVPINRDVAYNKVTHTDTLTTYASEPRGNKFEWIDAGTEAVFLNYPITYILGIGALVPLAIYAYKKGVPTVLPATTYTLEQRITANLIYTVVTVDPPLSQREEDWDNDQIYANVANAVGPNVVDILIWTIQTFTGFNYDATSFNHVKALVTNYPANFCLLTRKNVIEFLREVAFQARCSIWLNGNIFYLRYLPEVQTAVETITLQDIVTNTLQINSTETERLTTKFIAEYRYSLDQQEPCKIIFKYNVAKYGSMEETFDFYIYNTQEAVEKSAEFWMIRKANSFKVLQFKTAIHKLKLEAFDPVLVNLPSDLACEVPVVGIVQKSVYNSETNQIDMEVWIPVRMGEMTVYQFAHPKDLNETFIFPDAQDPKIGSDNPFKNANGDLIDKKYVPVSVPFMTLKRGYPWNWGRDHAIGDGFDTIPEPPKNITFLAYPELLPNIPAGLSRFNAFKSFQVFPAKPILVEPIPPASWPGFVLSKSGNGYIVSTYMRGTANAAVNLKVNQFYARSNETIVAGTPCVVHRLIYRLSDGSQAAEYFMQVPVWVAPQSAP